MNEQFDFNTANSYPGQEPPPYSNQGGYQPPMGGYPPPYFALMNREKKDLRFMGSCAGLAVLLFMLLQQLLSLLIAAFGLKELYFSDPLFENCTGIIMTVICIALPFYLIASLQKRRFPTLELLPLEKPQSPSLTLLAIPAGLMLCLAGNIVSTVTQGIFGLLGREITTQYIADPVTPIQTLFYWLRVTVLAAIIEEVAIRGVVMQPLRKYGNGFAIVMSSLVFSVMHGNFVQAPFAFAAGLVLGYFAVATESLWTSLFIHLANNLYALAVSELYTVLSTKAYSLIERLLTPTVIISGIICLVLFVKKRGRVILPPAPTVLTTGQRFGAYTLNPPLLIALGVMLLSSLKYVN